MGNATPSAALLLGKDPVPIVWGAGWASGSVWTGEESLAPTGIRSSDRSPRSELLYRLSYHGTTTRAYEHNLCHLVYPPHRI